MSQKALLAVVLLAQLATDGSRNSKARVYIGKEHGRVRFDLANVETFASVFAACDDTRGEGAGNTADASSGTLVRAFWVRKGNAMTRILMLVTDGSLQAIVQTASRKVEEEYLPGWARFTHGRFMDVGGRLGGRLIVAAETSDGDVVANHILVRVDAKVERAAAALQATSKVVLSVNHILGLGEHAISRGECKRAAGLLVVIGSGSQVGAVARDGGRLDDC